MDKCIYNDGNCSIGLDTSNCKECNQYAKYLDYKKASESMIGIIKNLNVRSLTENDKKELACLDRLCDLISGKISMETYMKNATKNMEVSSNEKQKFKEYVNKINCR